MTCPKCKSEHRVKAGNHHGRQKHKCKECGYQYTCAGDKNAAIRARALYLYICGLPARAIARMFSAAPSTVLYWARNFALKTYEKPVPRGAVSIELDEMRHFIRSKKQMPDLEGILPRYRPAGWLGMRVSERRNPEKDA